MELLFFNITFQIFGGDMFYVAMSLVQLLDFPLINIKSQDSETAGQKSLEQSIKDQEAEIVGKYENDEQVPERRAADCR